MRDSIPQLKESQSFIKAGDTQKENQEEVEEDQPDE